MIDRWNSGMSLKILRTLPRMCIGEDDLLFGKFIRDQLKILNGDYKTRW